VETDKRDKSQTKRNNINRSNEHKDKKKVEEEEVTINDRSIQLAYKKNCFIFFFVHQVFPALNILKNRTNLATKKLIIKYQRFRAVGRFEINIRQRRTSITVLKNQRILRKLFKCRCAPVKLFISSFKT